MLFAVSPATPPPRCLTAAVLALVTAGSAIPAAAAGELSGCDALQGTQQLSCIEVWYPEHHRRVEESCSQVTDSSECRRKLYAAVGISFASVPTASAGKLDGCDALEGREQLSCIEVWYPDHFRRVEDGCLSHERPRECRREGYGAVGISFTPKSGGRGDDGERKPQGRSGRTDGAETNEGTEPERVATYSPRYLTVRFVGAQIGPGKASGENWDGTGTISPAAVTAVAALITHGASLTTSAASGEIGAAALNSAVQGTAAPDVAGLVYVTGTTTKELAVAAITRLKLAEIGNMKDDSYTPGFSYTVEYTNWPVYADTRFELTLWDVDYTENDSIGVVQINETALLAALAKGTIMEVPVADQCSGQILNIKVSVSAGAGSASPSLANGTPLR